MTPVISHSVARPAAPDHAPLARAAARPFSRPVVLDALAFLLALLALLVICASGARAQVAPNAAGEFGDAPEGILAYSNVQGLPVTGRFPTLRGGAAGVIFHAAAAPSANCFFGWTIDYEWDGYSTTCASPYEQDEPRSPNDCESGVAGPEPYTIVGGLETPLFNTLNPRPFGVTGEVGHWGQGPDDNLDVWITNNRNATAYVNILVDWDQDGDWDSTPYGAAEGELSPASTSSSPVQSNWILHNFAIPPLYNGWISALHPSVFPFGVNAGFVWARLTITPVIISAGNWSGTGLFTLGATADYLWRVAPGGGESEGAELGDAPDGSPAYPGAFLIGAFPTCLGGTHGSVWHSASNGVMFGQYLDFETDGNHNNCAFNPYDNDERFQDPDGDAGLLWPAPYTLDQLGNAVPLGLPGMTHDIGPACSLAHWGADIDMQVTNNSPNTAYINVLFDWDRSGTWGGPSFQCNGNTVTEWSLANVAVGPFYNGPLSALVGSTTLPLGGEGYVWARFTISDDGVHQMDWDGSGSFRYGETEDYLLHVGPPATTAVQPMEPGSLKLELQQNRPNPVTGRTVIPFQLDVRGATRLDIFDIAGRKVRTLVDGELEPGAHTIEWDGRDEAGGDVSDGIYLYRLNAGDRVESRRMVMVKSRR